MLNDYSLFKLLHKIIDEGFDFYEIEFMSHPAYNTSTNTAQIELFGPPSSGNADLDYETFILIRIEEAGWRWLKKIEEQVVDIESPSEKVKYLDKVKTDFNNYFLNIESQNHSNVKKLTEVLTKIESDFNSRFAPIYEIYQLSEDEIKSKLHFNLNQNELALLLIILDESGILKIPKDIGRINVAQSIYSIGFFGESHFTVKRDSEENGGQHPSRSLSTQIRKFKNRTLDIDSPLNTLENHIRPFLDKDKLEKIFGEYDEREKRK